MGDSERCALTSTPSIGPSFEVTVPETAAIAAPGATSKTIAATRVIFMAFSFPPWETLGFAEPIHDFFTRPMHHARLSQHVPVQLLQVADAVRHAGDVRMHG